MDSKKFKKAFDFVAKNHGFKKDFGGWFQESPECIVVLDLQKSNYGNSYYLNIKVYIQGIFGTNYVKNKFLVKNDVGDVFTRQPKEYNNVLDFDNTLNDVERVRLLEELFIAFIVPFTSKTLSRSGIKVLAERGEVFLLPAVKEELKF